MIKTIKLNNDTHSRLANEGNAGESFDHVINRLIDIGSKRTILLLYKLTDKDPPRELYLANPLYYWTEENYIKFLELTSKAWSEWTDTLLRIIANNDKYYHKIQQHRKKSNK